MNPTVTDNDRTQILTALAEAISAGFRHNVRHEPEPVRRDLLDQAGIKHGNYYGLMHYPKWWDQTHDEWWIALARVLNYQFPPCVPVP